MPWKPRRVRIPFRIAIITAVVGLLLPTGIFLMVFSVARSRKDIQFLKEAYLEQLAEAAMREISGLPQRAEVILLAHKALAENGALPTTDSLALARLFGEVLRQKPDLAWLSYGDAPSGQFAGANRIGVDDIILNISNPGINRGIPLEYTPMPDGSLKPYIRTPPLTASYDPRTRPWFRGAVANSGQIVWMPPYLFAEGVMGITAAISVNEGENLRGVLTADISLDGINFFLQSLKVSRHGIALLYNREGQLLAGGKGPAFHAAEQALHSKQSPRQITGNADSAESIYDGAKYGIITKHFTGATGLHWTLVISVPEEDFMGPVYANRRIAAIITLTGLALATCIGILLSAWISNSIIVVTTDLNQIARFSLDNETGKASALKEVALLQEALSRLKASLRSFARYAPEEIVREVVVSGREAILSGKKEDITLLFCDLRGFTAFAEKTRPEDVVAILNDHYDTLSALVTKWEGYVIDFFGDSMFAIFGAPRPCENHPTRAVACAMEMQLIRQSINSEYLLRGWPPLEMGIGINTGFAVVGNMGSSSRIKYSVVGHPVNLASRIENFTVGGQVLISQTTREALGEEIDVEGPILAESKGVGGFIEMWEVRRLKSPVHMELPSPFSDLLIMNPPLSARLRLVQGKQIEAEVHPAEIIRISPSAAEIRTPARLPALTAVQILLQWDDGASATLDGKIHGMPNTHDGQSVLAIRFGGVSWDVRFRLEELARSRAVS